ncbi:Hypothetical protein A7982_05533 [Minicystis rosea]|nr:Hypothetical protein A7982_05533 [Minicystis rosea]
MQIGRAMRLARRPTAHAHGDVGPPALARARRRRRDGAPTRREAPGAPRHVIRRRRRCAARDRRSDGRHRDLEKARARKHGDDCNGDRRRAARGSVEPG